jgi:phage gpG-like protein
MAVHSGQAPVQAEPFAQGVREMPGEAVTEQIAQRNEWHTFELIPKLRGHKPLIDTGGLQEPITYQVVGGTLDVGTHRFANDAPRIASVLQFGTTRAGRGNRVTIPPRPCLGVSGDDAEKTNRATGNEVRSILGA